MIKWKPEYAEFLTIFSLGTSQSAKNLNIQKGIQNEGVFVKNSEIAELDEIISDIIGAPKPEDPQIYTGEDVVI